MALCRRVLAHLPQNNVSKPARRATADPADRRDPALDDVIPEEPTQPYDMHDVINRVVDDGEFLEIQPRLGGATSSSASPTWAVERRHRRAPAGGARRRAGHRRVGQGRPFRAHMRRVQRAVADVRRRARLPARRRPGARRHHSPRRQAAVRLRRGDRAQGDGHHAQGLWRRVRRHEQQAHPRRCEPGLAHGTHRGHGRRGRGQHHLPRRARRGRRTSMPSARAWPTSTRSASPTRTSPRAGATSTTSSCRRTRGHESSPRSRCSPASARRTCRASTATSRCKCLCAKTAPPFKRILVANRGEIAIRIMRACRELGIESVAVYSDADAGALHARLADVAVNIGPAPATDSYLRIDRVMDAARQTGADAIHPGYGFLSEQPEIADACAAAGITFIGPSREALDQLGDKLAARRRATAAGVPVVPGIFEPITLTGNGDEDALRHEAERIGYPVLVKAAAGGGGRGMRRVDAPDDLIEAVQGASREAAAAFGDGSVYLERYVERARHVEVQLLGDSQRHDRGPGRARLLRPAPPPEAGRGGARAGPEHGATAPAARAGRHRRRARSGCRTPRRPSSCSRPRATSGFSRSTPGSR